MNKKATVTQFMIILSLFCIINFNCQEKKNQNMNQAVTFYIMNYKKWVSDFRNNVDLPDSIYEENFFAEAEKYNFSDEIYEKVFLGHPIISKSIIVNALDTSYNIFKNKNSDEVVYYVLNPGAILAHLNSGFYDKYKSAELTVFKKFLKEIDNDKIYVVVEYNKKLGWINYDEMLKKMLPKK